MWIEVKVNKSSNNVNTVLVSTIGQNAVSICLGVFSADELAELAEVFSSAADQMKS